MKFFKELQIFHVICTVFIERIIYNAQYEYEGEGESEVVAGYGLVICGWRH